MIAMITGSSPDIFFYFLGESLILICIKGIFNDTNLNNSFKIHHFKKRKPHFHHCTPGDSNRLPQQLSAGAPAAAAQIFHTNMLSLSIGWKGQHACFA